MTEPLNVDGGRPAVARVGALPSSWTTDADRLVLFALACDSYDGMRSSPGAENLASWTGLHRGTVYEVMRRLAQPTSARPALVVVDETRRGRHRTRYRLTLPDAEPSGIDDGSNPATVAQPSCDRPASLTVDSAQPSSNRPAGLHAPFPLDSPPPTTPSSAKPLTRVGELLELVAEGVPEHLRPDRARLGQCCARLSADEWTPDELASWLRVQRWPADGSPGLAIYRLNALMREDRTRLSGRPKRARAVDARRCGHGQVDGMTVRGVGSDASRVCPSCETESPAEDSREVAS